MRKELLVGLITLGLVCPAAVGAEYSSDSLYSQSSGSTVEPSTSPYNSLEERQEGFVQQQAAIQTAIQSNIGYGTAAVVSTTPAPTAPVSVAPVPTPEPTQTQPLLVAATPPVVPPAPASEGTVIIDWNRIDWGRVDFEQIDWDTFIASIENYYYTEGSSPETNLVTVEQPPVEETPGGVFLVNFYPPEAPTNELPAPEVPNAARAVAEANNLLLGDRPVFPNPDENYTRAIARAGLPADYSTIRDFERRRRILIDIIVPTIIYRTKEAYRIPNSNNFVGAGQPFQNSLRDFFRISFRVTINGTLQSRPSTTAVENEQIVNNMAQAFGINLEQQTADNDLGRSLIGVLRRARDLARGGTDGPASDLSRPDDIPAVITGATAAARDAASAVTQATVVGRAIGRLGLDATVPPAVATELEAFVRRVNGLGLTRDQRFAVKAAIQSAIRNVNRLNNQSLLGGYRLYISSIPATPTTTAVPSIETILFRL